MTSEPVEQPSARVQPDPLPMVRPAVQAAPIQPVVAAPAPTPPRPAPPVAASGPSAPARTVSAGSASTGDGPGTSPAARKAQQDYYAMIAAHLQRRKTYPPEARKARQQGIVTVRFTVARDGSVSAVSIKRSSGHELLDGATLDLMQRVAPLPRMPASMEKDSVTLSLPIEYSLRTE
ncbi:energy transducer TonB [Novosphingobium profundi]|uniref:energy transducer TonB n=1 Tax=Novosphingobium profundi TaxID=1774954 RepID=UPI001BDA9163|nr:energy transducer TonB [Novosphingobium profundi]MBT0671056.1 energy transducer TonB [Novosphingobium profundi]